MKTITSRENPGFRQLRTVAAGKERGRALLDGIHLCEAWAERGWPVLACAFAEDAAGHAEIAPLIAAADRLGADLLALGRPLMAQVSQLDSAAPIVWVVAPPTADLARLAGRDAIALDGVQDPGNVGTMLRTAAAAGVKVAIAGPGTAGFWSPKVLRAGMGAQMLLDCVEVPDLGAALDTLGVPVIGTVVRGASNLYGFDLRGPRAWVFGNEGRGLSAAIDDRLDERCTIPHSGAIESLNVGAAAAVCLFEMQRQRMAG
ncbi:TrmH family RNA methyltransferase [Derxia gummosa]|uniref:TrmH family RNA methyltransferase n=1 Tax=Derxia gummosa DSM 723 TaxID=1121388 RepID=A0A8B6X3Q5_9BURK|nr:RNA methyltransferase [Derxia gummosa]